MKFKISSEKTISILTIVCLVLIVFSCKPELLMPERRGRRQTHQPAKDQTKGSTFTINLNTDNCEVNIEKKLGLNSLYEEEVVENTKVRKITINSIPSHAVGTFPNDGNPNTIKAQPKSFDLPLNPAKASHITMGMGFQTGILFSGVTIDPFTAEFFVGSTGKTNREWNITTLTSTENLGLDCNNGHVQPHGKYHYHGVPSAYLAQIDLSTPKMVKIGYAADGFPIYYKYGYAKDGSITANKSGYLLKKGKRKGDGVTAPNGYYNGRYFKDYEYVQGISDLDECNGKWGRTPENENEYYYVITDNFPSVPLCFSGTPNEKMRVGPRRGRRGRHGHRHPH